jgi:hypothetical protein
MRKLNQPELENLKEQLGGDVHLYDHSADEIFSEEFHPTADARVPSLKELRDEDSVVASDAAHLGTTILALKKRNVAGSAGTRKQGQKGKKPSQRNSSDYSVRFGPKNSDRGSKVAVVSSKSKKIIYEQG